ncbi:hypothetical protein GBSOP10_10212 [Armatimonadetes bacterium GBS]|jgi:ribosome-binding protein aMBF1 (putative translation factor)|nr:hypothetical protein HRbin14_01205 [bacterium HR14]CUU02656.1 hypothetical protein GBSOP10_10212 [Armatimonadetes bacterium GBS]CUU38584.1 hypothetical protein GXSOP10_14027 [Armatimonadetes bacterium GXS]
MPRYVLAALARTSPGIVSAWEKWGAVPNRSIVERIARALEVEPDELLDTNTQGGESS